MNVLMDVFKGFSDGERVLVKLESGDSFLLYDFEEVDGSVYDRDDVLIATIDSIVSSDFSYRVGTTLEFGLGSVEVLSDPAGMNIYYMKR